MTAPPDVRILRRSPGRLRLQAPGLMSDAGLGLARIAAADGVFDVSLSRRTGNVLIGFDESRIDEPSVLALVAVPPACVRPQRDLRGGSVPPAAVGPPRAPQGRSDPAAPVGSGWLRAERSQTLRARPAACVAELIDFERHPRWQDYVTEVTVLERDRRGRGLRVATEARVGERELQFTTNYRYPSPNRVLFEQDEGELEAVRGSWTFRSLGAGRCRATYALQVKPGWRLGLMLRGPLYEQLRDLVLDHVMNELRGRVESRAPEPAGD